MGATTRPESLESELEVPFLKGEVQPAAYRDVKFAYLFLFNIIASVTTACVYGPAIWKGDTSSSSDATTAGSDNSDNNGNVDDVGAFNTGSFFAVLIASFFAAILTTSGLLYIIMMHPHLSVQISFLSAPLLLLVVAVAFSAFDADSGATLAVLAVVFGVISALTYLCYRRFVPFAASTLRTALSAIRFHQVGLYTISVGGMALSFAVAMVYCTALAGIYVHADQKGEAPCSELYPQDANDANSLYGEDEMCMTDPPNPVAHFLLLLSLFWTTQVIQNVLHCTTAGTVGTWWFSGVGDPSWWSREVTDSFGRATTYSFGSICLGSLLVAILQALEQTARSARRNRRGALLACVLECLLHLLRRWLEYFNSWAFVYVGLYGYPYLTAGKNVVELFSNRGWGTFVSDRLVFRVLYASQMAVALVSGAFAALIDATVGSPMFTTLDATTGNEDAAGSHGAAFFIGFLLGLVLAKCSLFVVESSVRTVIVCFAESPADFKEHHGELCQEMRDGWAAAYPEAWTSEHDLLFAEVISTTSHEQEEEEKKSLVV